MSGARLSIEGLAKRWPDGAHALADVRVSVPAGTALAVLGPSGAGKSTLLRCIAGLERPDAGTIRLGERVLVGPETFVPPEDRGVGMVFQALELWPHMTVAEHLAFGLPGRPRGRAAKRHATVRALAEAVGLPARLLGRRPGTLSGGEQQRVAIARTLAPEPDVILYDEPLANLDPDRRTSIRALIRRLAREHGTTLVYVTHDAEEALELGDAVAVFGDGRLIEEGEPMALYRRPGSLAAARALGPISAVPGTVSGGRARTPLGEHPTSLDDGPCVALWRPEGLQAAPDGTVSARVEDVIARGTHYAFTARVGEVAVRGASVEPLGVGAEVTLRVEAPAAVLAGDLPEEVA